MINSTNSSSSNVYPMDCEPSLNMNQQRYLQHMHRSNRFNVPPLTLGSSYISQQKYAPTSLPLDLITVATAAANNGNGSSSIMVLPSTATQDHLNKVGTGSSRNNNSNTNNNNADEMVGVCVQQSPVVIH